MGHRDNRAAGVRPPVDAREGVMLIVGSLFSGIGGLDLGLGRAGMSVAWQVENDPFCAAVLEKHWPGVKRYGDIREIRWEEVESVDLVCGGFPCQPVSLAGRRLGTTDDRWLWPEFARCVRTVRPRYVLVENVPGLLVRGMGDVLGDLAACGYDAEWDCLPAAAVGAPHLRYRVFIVAYPAGTQRDAGTEISGELLGDDADGQEPDYADRSGADVADTQSAGQLRAEQLENDQGRQRGWQESDDPDAVGEVSVADVADCQRARLEERPVIRPDTAEELSSI